ncbi:unnamed product [Ostreococcus tauri]|uniref:Unnamed product n=2 Tax=Ostreococcus tauri TaxID=70448 RepID=A0A090M379_OSTTA|nr:unnamed product [Ostreococcus tauri]CEF98656.1 unnamed product [Ostreococcus tauri]|eukprot:XP_003080255.2 unnamed product [Ostreococcus tauri]
MDAVDGSSSSESTSEEPTGARGGERWTTTRARYMDYEWRRRAARVEAAARARATREAAARRRRTGTADGTAGGEVPNAARRERSERLAGRHSRKKVEAEVLARRRMEETFSPRVHVEARRRDASGETTLDKLAKPKTAMWERAANEKAARDAEVFGANCTFAPKTGRKPKASSSKPASERLYELADKKLESREREHARLAAEEMGNLTFRPSVRSPPPEVRAKIAKVPPLHERVNDVLRAKERVKETARAKVEDELSKSHTFKPTLNPTSVALAKQRAEIERSMADGADERTSAPRRRFRTDDPDADFTFEPKLVSKSGKVVDELTRRGKLGAGFLERQRDFNEKVARRRAEQQLAKEDDECTFTPDIGNAGEVLRSGGRYVRNLIETPEERARRLAFDDADMKRAKQSAREREHYEQFTYKPKLNEKSRTLAPYGSAIDDLARDERRELARKRAQAEIEREFRQEHTFEPNLDRSSDAQRARHKSQRSMDYGVGGDAVSARIDAYRREKEIALENLRKRAEYRELEECTFRPETTTLDTRSMYSPSISKVKGVDSFLQKQAKARQIEEEKRERYARVFYEELDDFDRRHRRTIPEPFSVAENVDEKAARRRKALAEERVRRELEECTFEPATNASRRS